MNLTCRVSILVLIMQLCGDNLMNVVYHVQISKSNSICSRSRVKCLWCWFFWVM